MKVLIFGGSGMLGEMLCRVLAREPEFDVHATLRNSCFEAVHEALLPRVTFHRMDSCGGSDNLRNLLFGCAWTINAAGSIKQRKADEGAEPAMLINALFPHRLARMAEESHTQILQIATDCVFSGREGGRVESSPHDALDVYGKTKSLGEVRAPHVHHLRCSIIGPDRRKKISLLEWFLHEPRAASVPGFTNHRWNGITTYHFARICAGILRSRATLSGLQHIVPEGWMTKHELLKLLSQVYERRDIQVVRTEAKQAVDRTLETVNPIENCRLWSLGGYRHPPSIPEMVRELAQIEPELGFQR